MMKFTWFLINCFTLPSAVPFLGRGVRALTGRLTLRRLQISLLAVIFTVGTSVSSANSQCSQVFNESKPFITERIAKNKFITNRHLDDYTQGLHSDFTARLKQLTSQNHWVDLGAGKATAQIEFIKSFPSKDQAPQATAVAFKIDRWFAPPSFGGKLKIAEGAYETQPTSTWQKADVVTDVYGVLSYTGDLGISLQKTFDMMNVGGELYMLVSAWGAQVSYGGVKHSLVDFLNSVPGIKVEGNDTQIKITKLQNSINVPSLRLTSYKDEGPPIRNFEVIL